MNIELHLVIQIIIVLKNTLHIPTPQQQWGIYRIYFLPIEIMEPVNLIDQNITLPKSEIISSPIESELELELLESPTLVNEFQENKNQAEEHLVRSEEVLDLSQNVRTLTNQSTSQPLQLWKESLAEKQLSTIIQALEKAGLDDDYIMWVIKEGIESAVFQGPKGAMLRDRPSIIKLVDKYLKLKKYYKSDTVINVLNAFANPWQLY